MAHDEFGYIYLKKKQNWTFVMYAILSDINNARFGNFIGHRLQFRCVKSAGYGKGSGVKVMCGELTRLGYKCHSWPLVGDNTYVVNQMLKLLFLF